MTLRLIALIGLGSFGLCKSAEVKLLEVEHKLSAKTMVVQTDAKPTITIKYDTIREKDTVFFPSKTKCQPCQPCERKEKQTVTITASGVPFFDTLSHENFLPITGDNKENVSIVDTNLLIPHHSKIKSK